MATARRTTTTGESRGGLGVPDTTCPVKVADAPAVTSRQRWTADQPSLPWQQPDTRDGHNNGQTRSINGEWFPAGQHIGAGTHLASTAALLGAGAPEAVSPGPYATKGHGGMSSTRFGCGYSRNHGCRSASRAWQHHIHRRSRGSQSTTRTRHARRLSKRDPVRHRCTYREPNRRVVRQESLQQVSALHARQWYNAANPHPRWNITS